MPHISDQDAPTLAPISPLKLETATCSPEVDGAIGRASVVNLAFRMLDNDWGTVTPRTRAENIRTRTSTTPGTWRGRYPTMALDGTVVTVTAQMTELDDGKYTIHLELETASQKKK